MPGIPIIPSVPDGLPASPPGPIPIMPGIIPRRLSCPACLPYPLVSGWLVPYRHPIPIMPPMPVIAMPGIMPPMPGFPPLIPLTAADLLAVPLEGGEDCLLLLFS